jgi:hypothetical protein
MTMLRRSFLRTAIGAGVSSAMAAESEGALTVAESMNLAGQHLLGLLSPAYRYIPYWGMKIQADLHAHWYYYWPAHNLGRWWDSLLQLESVSDFRIPPDVGGAMRKNLVAFFNNPDNLCFPPDYAADFNPKGEVELHSLRESLLGLQALAQYRNDSWALDQGHRMLETVWKISRQDASWDLEKLEAYRRLGKQAPRHLDPTGSNGRMMEALLWFYRDTGDPLAMALAERFASYHLANSTYADGTLNHTSRPDHTHSYLGTLRGLLLFGEITNQREYIELVAATYRTTVLGRLLKPSGYITHDLATESVAEPSSVGDIIQLGLWLSRHGYTEFLDDCERLVRCRLLPCQITEVPKLKPHPAYKGDEGRDVAARAVGAFGGLHKPQWGKRPITDITCAVLHSMVDVYRHIAVRSDAGLTINFHLTYQDSDLRIASSRETDASVAIEPRRRENLLVRIPGWTPAGSVRIRVNGVPLEFRSIGRFAYIPREVLPATVVMQYDLPIRTEVEDTAGVRYTFRWKGDEIAGVTPNDDFFPFYPTLKV